MAQQFMSADRNVWRVHVEPLDGRFVKYLVCLTRGGLQYGPDGFGWHKISLAGAKRKGARELAKRVHKDEVKALRRTLIDG